MGSSPSKLDDEQNSLADQDERLAFAASCLRGWRPYMEDFHTAILRLPHREYPHMCPHVYICTIPPPDPLNVAKAKVEGDSPFQFKPNGQPVLPSPLPPNIHQTPYTFTQPLFEPTQHFSFFGVYDGHRGNKASHFVSRRLHWRVASETAFRDGDYPLAIENGFLFLDAELKQTFISARETEQNGSTAVMALVTDDGRLFAASAGDSRCVLSNMGNAVPMSFDHKPEYPDEEARIHHAGGFVVDGRVMGRLATSRSFGDFDFKTQTNKSLADQIITAKPDIYDRRLEAGDEFFILGSDGIWDVLTSQNAVDFVRSHVASGMDLKTISERLLERCVATNPEMYNMTGGGGAGCDNLTAIVVAILNGKTYQQWAAEIKQRWAAIEVRPVIELKMPDPPAPPPIPCGWMCLDDNKVTITRAAGDTRPVTRQPIAVRANADGLTSVVGAGRLKEPLKIDDPLCLEELDEQDIETLQQIWKDIPPER